MNELRVIGTGSNNKMQPKQLDVSISSGQLSSSGPLQKHLRCLR
jgi:hypothetical protein